MNKNFLFVLLIAASLLLLSFSESGFLRSIRGSAVEVVLPVNKNIYLTMNKGKFLTGTLNELKNITAENVRLKTENNKLKAKVASLREKEKRLEVLEKELNIRGLSSQNEFVGAAVVGRNPSSFRSVVTIDKGKDDGLSVNQAVLANGSLIGKIIRVYSSSSQVELITSYRFRTPVVLQDSRLLGLLVGGLKGVQVEQLPIDGKIIKGETVLTSGLAGEFPPGIPIGKAGKVVSEPSDIFKTLSVDLPANVGDAEIVFVMVK